MGCPRSPRAAPRGTRATPPRRRARRTSSATSGRSSPPSSTRRSEPSRRSPRDQLAQRVLALELGIRGTSRRTAPESVAAARTRWRSSWSVGRSAQCRSSSTSTSGPLAPISASSAATASKNRWRWASSLLAAQRADARSARRAELRQEHRELGRAGAQPRSERLQRRAARPPAQHLDERLVGSEPLLVEAPVEHDRAALVRATTQLGRQAGLADPRVPREQGQPARAAACLGQQGLERPGLVAPPHEAVASGEHAERRWPRVGGGRGHGACRQGERRWRLAAQQSLVHSQRGGARHRSQFLAQQRAQFLEGAQRLGRVARHLVDLHQQDVCGLAERRDRDRRAGRLLGRLELPTALTQTRESHRLEAAQADRLELAALLVQPRAVAVGQEARAVHGRRRPSVRERGRPRRRTRSPPRPAPPRPRRARCRPRHRDRAPARSPPRPPTTPSPSVRRSLDSSALNAVSAAAGGRSGHSTSISSPREAGRGRGGRPGRRRAAAPVDREAPARPGGLRSRPGSGRRALSSSGCHEAPSVQATGPPSFLQAFANRPRAPCSSRLRTDSRLRSRARRQGGCHGQTRDRHGLRQPLCIVDRLTRDPCETIRFDPPDLFGPPT